MSAVYVYSTLSNDQAYQFYDISPLGMPIPHPKNITVVIKGKANIALPTPSGGLMTSKGMVTKLTEKEYDLVAQHPLFKDHLQNNFLAVENTKFPVKSVVNDMQPRDESAPLTPEIARAQGMKLADPVKFGK